MMPFDWGTIFDLWLIFAALNALFIASNINPAEEVSNDDIYAMAVVIVGSFFFFLIFFVGFIKESWEGLVKRYEQMADGRQSDAGEVGGKRKG